ncbi:MAG: hypothetical protein AVDCRST_MAG17-1367 [uncultured Solirubrobacterales bacterium]|uniref:Uncharacterized protein n=1 Tax=uncultured Solirubrobacterales bacterium TaxID=768556 RepID=A0A6J4SK97_9ACTN|nr:MAG: hypothetical protein AVDCRST_MAG17-1367 [uncultured Solirubrobacterales bacterium]
MTPRKRNKPLRRRLVRKVRKEGAEGVEEAVEDGCGCGCAGDGCLSLVLVCAIAPKLLRSGARGLR